MDDESDMVTCNNEEYNVDETRWMLCCYTLVVYWSNAVIIFNAILYLIPQMNGLLIIIKRSLCIKAFDI